MAQSFGWPMAFFFVGIPGLLSGLSATRLPDLVRLPSEAIGLRDFGITAIGLFPGAPAMLVSLETSAKAAVLAWFGAFFMSWDHVPLRATIHDLVPSGHAAGRGLYYLFVHLFAMALAPLVVGRAASRYGPVHALHIPIAGQLMGGAGFKGVVFSVRHRGFDHRGLSRHWEPKPWMPSLVTAAFGSTSI